MLKAFVRVSSAETNEKESFSFVVIGHVIGLSDERMNPIFNELLTEVRKLYPDMIFLTGGPICNFGNSELRIEPTVAYKWNRLDSELGQLGVPVYRVPDKHDITTPGTGDIFSASYGGLPQAICYQESLFILLNTAGMPEEDKSTSYRYFRGESLDFRQIDFVRKKLSEDEPYDHVFLFMHHMPWWSDDNQWWHDIHPLLIGHNVRAVFGGDLGPMKFSHTRRDGIDYIQSVIEQVYAIDNPQAVKQLRKSEGARLLAQQFDNFLYVVVDGSEVNIEVKVVGAMSSGKFSPQRFRDVHGDVGHRVETPKTETSLVKRVCAIVGTPKRLAVLALVMGICFLGGVTTVVVWSHLKTG